MVKDRLVKEEETSSNETAVTVDGPSLIETETAEPKIFVNSSDPKKPEFSEVELTETPTATKHNIPVEFTDGPEEVPFKKLTFKQKLAYIYEVLKADRTHIWVFLTIVGVVAGAVAWVHDIVVSKMYQYRKDLALGYVENAFLQFLIWLVFNLVFQCFCLYLTFFVEPTAEGSGVAGMKALLNGAPLEAPLKFRTVFVRTICLPLILGTGVYMGKTDMFIGAALANQFLRLPIFSKLSETAFLKEQILACGLATGVAANFGTPVAGILFSVEIIGTYYSLRTYLKSFYISTITAFTVTSLHAIYNQRTYVVSAWKINISQPGWDIPELLLYIVLGVLMGILAIIFVTVVKYVYIIRDGFIGRRRLLFFGFDKYRNYNTFIGKVFALLENRVLAFYIVCIITSIVSFPKVIGGFMALGSSKQVEDVLLTKPLTSKSGTLGGDWGSQDPALYKQTVMWNLFLCAMVRYVMQWLSAPFPVPGGVLVPLMATGAVFGRLYGEFMEYLFPNSFIIGTPPIPAGYGLAGAAALSAGVTHAFSTAIILMEMGGNTVHIPSLVAVIVSIRTCKAFSPSIYDTIIKFRKWNAFLESKTDREKILVKDIMVPIENYAFVSTRTNKSRINKLLEEFKDVKEFPVTDTDENMYLLGAVTREDLEKAAQASAEQKTHDETVIQLPIKTCTYTLAEELSALKTHMVFSMLKLHQAYVIRTGRIVGVVRRADVIYSKVQLRKSNPIYRLGLYVKKRFQQFRTPGVPAT